VRFFIPKKFHKIDANFQKYGIINKEHKKGGEYDVSK